MAKFTGKPAENAFHVWTGGANLEKISVFEITWIRVDMACIATLKNVRVRNYIEFLNTNKKLHNCIVMRRVLVMMDRSNNY